MTGTFDQVRAINDEVQGLSEVRIVLRTRERAAEEAAARAEVDLNAIRKLTGFCDAELERKKAVRDELIRQREEKNK